MARQQLARAGTRTVADGPPGNLPQNEAQGPDVHPLVGLKAIHLDGVVQHLGGHVALGSHFGVVAHVQLVGVLEMHDGQTWRTTAVFSHKRVKGA